MAERFVAEGVQITLAKNYPKLEVALDCGNEFVDLYLGKGVNEVHLRWDRKTGKLISPAPPKAKSA